MLADHTHPLEPPEDYIWVVTIFDSDNPWLLKKLNKLLADIEYIFEGMQPQIEDTGQGTIVVKLIWNSKEAEQILASLVPNEIHYQSKMVKKEG